MSATSIGQATVIRMLFKANPLLRKEFIDSSVHILSTHGVTLEQCTAEELTLAVTDEFIIGKAHVIFSDDIDNAQKD